MRLALLCAAAFPTLAGCGMSFEECRDDALKEWQKCAGEAIRNEYPRPGALGDCVRTHRRKADACERLPKESEQAAAAQGPALERVSGKPVEGDGDSHE